MDLLDERPRNMFNIVGRTNGLLPTQNSAPAGAGVIPGAGVNDINLHTGARPTSPGAESRAGCGAGSGAACGAGSTTGLGIGTAVNRPGLHTIPELRGATVLNGTPVTTGAGTSFITCTAVFCFIVIQRRRNFKIQVGYLRMLIIYFL